MVEDAILEASCRRALVGAVGPAGRTLDDAIPLSTVALASLGLSFISRERAVATLESVFSCQTDDGRIPPTPGERGVVLPLLGSVLRWVFLYMSEYEPPLALRVQNLLERLNRFHRLLYQRRDPTYRASTADDGVLDRVAVDGTLDVGINSVLVQSETDLMDVVMQSGRPAQEMLVRRTRRAAALVKQTWSAEDGLFRSRDADSGVVDPPSVEGLLPLYCGAALPPHAASMGERYLQEGKGFWSPMPLSTLPMDSPAYRPDEPGRGAVSPLVNWMLAGALLRYGFESRAWRLHNATIALARNAGIWEAYNSQTGQGVGAPDAPLTAALILHMIRAPYFAQERCVY